MAKEKAGTKTGFKEEQPHFHSNFKRWIRVVALFVSVVFLPQQAAAKSDYSSSWTPTASQDQMQSYSNSTMESLHNEISAMRTHAEHMFIKDIGISIGSSLAMAGLSSVAKPWFNTASTGAGSKVLGLGPTARWAITGAVAGTAAHGLTTGQWFKGNWYLYTAGGATIGAAVPSVAQSWNTPGSWLNENVASKFDAASDRINTFLGRKSTVDPWLLSADTMSMPKMTVTDPGLMGNLGFSGVARGFSNAGIVTLSSNLFSLAGMKPQATELLSSFASGALLGMVGGLNNLTNGLNWYQAGISGGLTSAASTYTTRLAIDDLGIKSPALAMFIGNTAGMATNVLVNGAFYSLNGNQYIDTSSKQIKIGSPTDLGSGDHILKAGISTYGDYIWKNSWRGLTAGLVGNGLTEMIIRNPKLIGLTDRDLQTLPYASAINSGFQGAFGGLLPGSRLTLTQSIAKGLLGGALTIGEAKLEADILRHNPKMTPVLASYLLNAGTAALRGLTESFITPQAFEDQMIKPTSIWGSVIESLSTSLSRDSLNVASFGYLGREQSLLGEISYMHTLTSTFGPRTPEMLKQQMAKNSLSGTAIGNGSTVNLSLSDGTIATLSLVGSSTNILPFMDNNPRKGLKYTDISGNTWLSNGNGTYSLASEGKKEEGSSFIAGWGQIAHDIYQSGAVRNFEGTLAAVLPNSSRNFLDLPKSFMADYEDQTGKTRTDRFTFQSGLDQSGSPVTELTIHNRWGNQIYTPMNAAPLVKDTLKESAVLEFFSLNNIADRAVQRAPEEQASTLASLPAELKSVSPETASEIKIPEVSASEIQVTPQVLPPIVGFESPGKITEIDITQENMLTSQPASLKSNTVILQPGQDKPVVGVTPVSAETEQVFSIGASNSKPLPSSTIESGDTLDGIMGKLNLPVDRKEHLIEFNKLYNADFDSANFNPNNLEPGKKFFIPPPEYFPPTGPNPYLNNAELAFPNEHEFLPMGQLPSPNNILQSNPIVPGAPKPDMSLLTDTLPQQGRAYDDEPLLLTKTATSIPEIEKVAPPAKPTIEPPKPPAIEMEPVSPPPSVLANNTSSVNLPAPEPVQIPANLAGLQSQKEVNTSDVSSAMLPPEEGPITAPPLQLAKIIEPIKPELDYAPVRIEDVPHKDYTIPTNEIKLPETLGAGAISSKLAFSGEAKPPQGLELTSLMPDRPTAPGEPGFVTVTIPEPEPNPAPGTTMLASASQFQPAGPAFFEQPKSPTPATEPMTQLKLAGPQTASEIKIEIPEVSSPDIQSLPDKIEPLGQAADLTKFATPDDLLVNSKLNSGQKEAVREALSKLSPLERELLKVSGINFISFEDSYAIWKPKKNAAYLYPNIRLTKDLDSSNAPILVHEFGHFFEDVAAVKRNQSGKKDNDVDIMEEAKKINKEFNLKYDRFDLSMDERRRLEKLEGPFTSDDYKNNRQNFVTKNAGMAREGQFGMMDTNSRSVREDMAEGYRTLLFADAEQLNYIATNRPAIAKKMDLWLKTLDGVEQFYSNDANRNKLKKGMLKETDKYQPKTIRW